MAALALILALLFAGPTNLTITYDPGGIIARRAAQVAAIGDEEVRIEGVCLSACTLWLAARNVCVTPEARLGFHGPSFWGLPLPERDFDYWSRVIAAHYPAPLADWYLRTGRYGSYSITGADLVRNGWARECG